MSPRPTPRRSPFRRRALAACVALGLGASGFVAAPAVAATLTVTSCADAGPGSLRAVVAAATSGDVVDLTGLTCGSIVLESLIDVSVIALPGAPLLDLTLQGPGRDVLTISGANKTAILRHGGNGPDGVLKIADLTLADGYTTEGLAGCVQSYAGVRLERATVKDCTSESNLTVNFGGAVGADALTMVESTISGSRSASRTRSAIGGAAYVASRAEIVDSVLSDNTVSVETPGGNSHRSGGGALYSKGTVEITRSTISGNSIQAGTQYGRGGGLLVRGSLVLRDSLVSGNVASGDGGGLNKANYTNYGDQITTLQIDNTTFSGNQAARGGAVSSTRPTLLRNSTIAFNQAATTGGFLFVSGGAATVALDLRSSLLAGNEAGDTTVHGADFGAESNATVEGEHNLVVDADAALLPAGTLRADPLLRPLADNGGPTATHALGDGSPALDAGANPAGFEFDQRGEGHPRVAGIAADIGAYEAADDDTIFRDGFDG